MRRFVVITTSVNGLHRWPGGQPDYLDLRHRHNFTVCAKLEVSHNEREIEIITVQDRINRYFPAIFQLKDGQIEFGARSCETIAEELINWLHSIYPSCPRLSVEILEDGILGAYLEQAYMQGAAIDES